MSEAKFRKPLSATRRIEHVGVIVHKLNVLRLHAEYGQFASMPSASAIRNYRARNHFWECF